MVLWRFLLVFALALGSVLPHCAAATPAPSVHHAGIMHDRQQPHHESSKAHVADACIGCATPIRFAMAARADPITTAAAYIIFEQKLATRFTAIDPPPPRQTA